MGIGSAPHEGSILDRAIGRFVNHILGEDDVPVSAEVGAIDVVFEDEPDDEAGPIGVEGLDEIGIVGTGSTVAGATDPLLGA